MLDDLDAQLYITTCSLSPPELLTFASYLLRGQERPLDAHSVSSEYQEHKEAGTWRPTEKGRVPLSQFPLLGWLKMPCGLHMSTCS